MRSIEDVQNHIKDVQDVKVVFFNYDSEDGYINARFQYKDSINDWWSAGIRST